MTGLMQTILPVWMTVFVMLFAFNVLYMIKVRTFFTYLREKQPKIWEELGCPSLFWNNSPSSQLKVLNYLRHRKFESADDPELIRLCRTMRGMLTLSVGGFTLLFLGFFVMFGDMAMHAK